MAQRQLAYQQHVLQGAAKVTGSVRVIPVVVHLIQQTPIAAISDARVQSQIDVLNEDFRKLNADTALIPQQFQGIAADCEIRFCLATIDPNGCPTNGINRVVAPALAIHGIDDEQALKSFVQWDPHKYLNMWVPVNLKDNLLGYATFPTWLQWDPGSDGVVINGNHFGRGFGTPASSYALGRTATHEVGHWLGLYHTFESGCAGMTPSNCLSQGDEVCDTPPTNGPTYGCPSSLLNTCQETPTDLDDQTMNYMDYTDDGCMYMFSEGQKVRVMDFMDNERAQIWSPANLAATGCDGTVSPGCLPIAAFEASSSNVCAGTTIQFTDRSFGPATAWEWTFQSGNPSTSTLQNPSVTWTVPGTYAVTLRATNGIGADTLVQNSFVTIAAPRTGPLVEGFEGLSGLPLEWYTADEDQQGSWTISTTAGSLGQQSIVAHNYIQATPLTRDDLVSHVMDLSGVADADLYFDHAYKRRASFVVDSLHVMVSTDCGATWQKVWEKWGIGLTTVGGYGTTAAFVPTAAQWRTDTVDLQPFAGQSAVRILFRSVGGASQDIYLDNINLSLPVARDEATGSDYAVTVFPNPAAATPPTIALKLSQSTALSAGLYDLSGRLIHAWDTQKHAPGLHRLEIPVAKWGSMPAGLYCLKVDGTSGTTSCKVVKVLE